MFVGSFSLVAMVSEKRYINGLNISFEKKGTGEPLVLLHGGLSDSRIWGWQVDELSEYFTVLAWDAPGCGRSDDPPEDFELSDYADCLAGLLRELGLVKPHVLGLSFGGGLAIEFYHRFPEVPASLILASAYAGWSGSLPPEVVKERVDRAIEQFKMDPDEVVEEWIPSLFSESVPKKVVQEVADVMSEFHPAGMQTMLKAFAKADLREVLPIIKVPVLLLYGDADLRSPLYIGKEMHRLIPNSTLEIVQGVGHVINIEVPTFFNDEVRSFIFQVKSNTGSGLHKAS
jgi:pimeloyl-ACP methyl ester carboxylesterase